MGNMIGQFNPQGPQWGAKKEAESERRKQGWKTVFVASMCVFLLAALIAAVLLLRQRHANRGPIATAASTNAVTQGTAVTNMSQLGNGNSGATSKATATTSRSGRWTKAASATSALPARSCQ